MGSGEEGQPRSPERAPTFVPSTVSGIFFLCLHRVLFRRRVALGAGRGFGLRNHQGRHPQWGYRFLLGFGVVRLARQAYGAGHASSPGAPLRPPRARRSLGPETAVVARASVPLRSRGAFFLYLRWFWPPTLSPATRGISLSGLIPVWVQAFPLRILPTHIFGPSWTDLRIQALPFRRSLK